MANKSFTVQEALNKARQFRPAGTVGATISATTSTPASFAILDADTSYVVTCTVSAHLRWSTNNTSATTADFRLTDGEILIFTTGNNTGVRYLSALSAVALQTTNVYLVKGS